MKAVSIALTSLVNYFVSFPKDDQIAWTKRKFLLLEIMPITIVLLSTAHEYKQEPHEREWEYLNQKGRHRINLKFNAYLILTICVVK